MVLQAVPTQLSYFTIIFFIFILESLAQSCNALIIIYAMHTNYTPGKHQ